MTAAVAGLLLAAGAGRRYGMPKALAVFDGRLLVERAAALLRDGGCDPVVVVLGAQADEVQHRADLTGCVVIVNEGWDSGMASSLQTGLATVEGMPVDAVTVLLVDTPGMTAAAIARVVASAGTDPAASLVSASYDGVPGHPVLLGRSHWAGVAAGATGDSGARAYLEANADRVVTVPCEDIADGSDLDHPQHTMDLCLPRAQTSRIENI